MLPALTSLLDQQGSCLGSFGLFTRSKVQLLQWKGGAHGVCRYMWRLTGREEHRKSTQ